MASYIQTASGNTASIGPIATDKVRIAAISSIAVAVGNSSVAANTTACEVIPSGTVERSFVVGQGNYLAYIGIGTGSHQPFSVTELGMPHEDTGTE
jgi:hypothetical protein